MTTDFLTCNVSSPSHPSVLSLTCVCRLTTFQLESLQETCWTRDKISAYTPCQKTVQICFCQNFVKFPPILIIFGRKMTKRLQLCEVYSFFMSINLHHHITVLNVDVPNCYTMLKVVSIAHTLHHQFNRGRHVIE